MNRADERVSYRNHFCDEDDADDDDAHKSIDN